MTNRAHHYTVDYVNGIKINADRRVGVPPRESRCEARTSTFRAKGKSSSSPSSASDRSTPAGIGNQEIFNSRGRKSRRRAMRAVIVTPAGDRRKESNFGSPRTGDRFCAEVLTNRSRFRVRNGVIYARLERKGRLGALAAQGSATRRRCKSRVRLLVLFVSIAY